MNLNDMRANAYKIQQNSQNEKKEKSQNNDGLLSDGKNDGKIDSDGFLKTGTAKRNDLNFRNDATVGRKTDGIKSEKLGTEKNVRPFVPAAFIKKSDLNLPDSGSSSFYDDVSGFSNNSDFAKASGKIKTNDKEIKSVGKMSGSSNYFVNAEKGNSESFQKVRKFQPEKIEPGFIKMEMGSQNLGASLHNEKNSSSYKNSYSPKVESKKQKDDPASYFSLKNDLDYATDALKSGGLLKVSVEKPEIEGKDSVYRRVAKFLVLIGENEAAKILPHLSEKQIEKIIPEIASIRSVSPEEASVIFEEFNQLLENARHSGGVETAREMLEKAYGKTRADEMMAKAMPVQNKSPFEYLNDEEPEKINLLLKDENVGVKSLVLSHLEPKKAAAVINSMPDEDKKEVVLRLARMEPINPDVLNRIDHAMKEKCNNQHTEKAEIIDGRNALAQILKKMDVGAEKGILSTISEDDPDLGKDLRSRLFTIADILTVDERIIQRKLREMSEVDVAYLIAGKKVDFREKILYNVSTGRREEILEQEEILKPMKKSDVDSVTLRFVSAIRNEVE